MSKLVGTSEHAFLTFYVSNVNLNILLLGFASIYGHRVSEIDEMFEARKMIGICPQSDINFDVLTVEENLSILASIKGIPANNIIQEVCYLYINHH
jgi:ABC-type multidrug transport system ATPase subunit